MKKKPDQVGAHVLLGTIFDMQKKPEEAEKYYRSALVINPEFVPAANNLAFMLADKNESLTEALSLAQTAKRKMPDDPMVMDTLGWVYYKQGLYDFAIAELSESAEKLSDNALVQYHLGLAYYKKGSELSAKKALSKALDLDPNFSGAENARQILADL